MIVREEFITACRQCRTLRVRLTRTLLLSPLNLTDEEISRECENTFCEEHKPWPTR